MLLIISGILGVPQKVKAQDYVQAIMQELQPNKTDESTDYNDTPDQLRLYDLANAIGTH